MLFGQVGGFGARPPSQFSRLSGFGAPSPIFQQYAVQPQPPPQPVVAQVAVQATKPRRPFRRNFYEAPPADFDVNAMRKELQIEIEEDARGIETTPAPIRQFNQLPMPAWVLEGLDAQGWSDPMPIQMQSWPILLSGRDLIGVAQTGSGKTGAFLVPALIHIEDQPVLTEANKGPVCLIVAPTRELAVQIHDEATKLMSQSWNGSKHASGGGKEGMRSAVLYGGGNKRDQKWAMGDNGSHILTATPGRLIDMMTQKDVILDRVTYLVLDEADRMLDMGFSGDIDTITGACRPDVQSLFFSATWTDDVHDLAKEMCSQDPVRIRVGARKAQGEDGKDVHSTREGIAQDIVVIDNPEHEYWKGADQKREIMDAHIRRALEASPDNKVLVFVQSKTFASELCDKLFEEGFAADCIHGGKKQDIRLWTLDEFRKGNIKVLVATDVIGRGLDIPNVSHVVVFEMGEVEDYVHRIGRTGRGKEGVGHALVFFEYFWKSPGVAAELIGVLERAKQKVPDQLRKIADEVANGWRKMATADDFAKSEAWAERKALARQRKREAKANGTWVDANDWGEESWSKKSKKAWDENDWKGNDWKS